MRGYQKWAGCVAFSPDGKTLASADGITKLFLHDAQTGRLLRELVCPGHPIYAVAFSPDGHYLVTSGEDPRLTVRALPSCLPVLWLPGHNKQVRKLAFGPGGKRPASAGLAGLVQLWDLERLAPVLDACKIAVEK